MKIQITKEYCKTWFLPTPIYYKAKETIRKTAADKSDFLKVDIKTQPGDRDIKTVAIYVPLF